MKRFVLGKRGSSRTELNRFIGCPVINCQRIANGADLVLEMGDDGNKPAYELLIEGPWEFSSCMMAASSREESDVELIGLAGATLTEVEMGEGRIDLRFGSICLSVFIALP